MTAIPLPLGPQATPETTLTGQDDAVVRRSLLPGGVRVLSEAMPNLASATVGCWIGVGSRDEAQAHQGSTHFLEHLLFKGTARRSAMDIATLLDGVGGEANAATGKEHTCYYARVRTEDLDLAVDVLLDMVTSARLDREDVESERGVILEELAMNDDDPSDVVHERFVELVMGDHPLGRPIGGTADTIGALGRDDIAAHYGRHYDPPALVITAGGGIDHDMLCRQVGDGLARAGWDVAPAQPRPRRATPATNPTGDHAPVLPSGQTAPHSVSQSARQGIPPERVRVVRRSIEQANVVLGTPGPTATDPRRHVMSVLNAVLGGGMSSRLFQEIREKRGLAYSVYSFATGYSDAGYFGLYAGCTPAKVDEVIGLLAAGLDELAAAGITAEELSRAQGQLSGSLVLGLEDSGSRMSRLGKAELVHGEFLTLQESLRRISAVTADDVQALAAELAGHPRSLCVVGPFEPDRTFEGV